MKHLVLLLVYVACFQVSGCAQSPASADRFVGDACEVCTLMFDNMPQNISWETNIAPANEPGEPMVISGRLLKKDGVTPAPGVILYVYHTDSKGYYSNPQGKGNRHGHLRGWMKSDANGRYKFSSIRPAPYPERNNPAHIHPLIKEPGLTLYWVDEFLFDDDPLVTAKVRAEQPGRGGKGIIHLTKNEKGVWIGQRDIILGLKVPRY